MGRWELWVVFGNDPPGPPGQAALAQHGSTPFPWLLLRQATLPPAQERVGKAEIELLV